MIHRGLQNVKGFKRSKEEESCKCVIVVTHTPDTAAWIYFVVCVFVAFLWGKKTQRKGRKREI